MKKTIEIVVHAYCPPGITEYAQHVKWQWAALHRWPPKTADVIWTVCFNVSDETTVAMLNSIWRANGDRIRINRLALRQEELFRRAVGRNKAAKASQADVLWFIDADYFVVQPALDDVAEYMDATSGLCMPRNVHISTDHATGHAMVERERYKLLPNWHESEFGELWSGPCIGGVQLVGGDFSRDHGYLDSTKWTKPVDPAAGFRSCRGDPRFRSWRKKIDPRPIQKLPIRGVYRIRHTSDGRDFDLAGINRGREVW